MNNEIVKEMVQIKEDILEMKKEMFRLNNLIMDIIKEIKNNSDINIEDKNSKEVEKILTNCLNDF